MKELVPKLIHKNDELHNEIEKLKYQLRQNSILPISKDEAKIKETEERWRRHKSVMIFNLEHKKIERKWKARF